MAVSTHRPHMSLNTDGQRHPVENSFTAITVLCGLVALVFAYISSMHVVASWAGVIGIGVGLRAQLISATRGERAVNVIALGAAGVGLAFGLAHGGLY